MQRLNVNSINVLAIVCDGSTRASIFGQATVDGLGVVNYRVDVQDWADQARVMIRTNYSRTTMTRGSRCYVEATYRFGGSSVC